jgi:hypothetical protein
MVGVRAASGEKVRVDLSGHVIEIGGSRMLRRTDRNRSRSFGKRLMIEHLESRSLLSSVVTAGSGIQPVSVRPPAGTGPADVSKLPQPNAQTPTHALPGAHLSDVRHAVA